VGLAERARENGVRTLFVGPEQLRELEPHASGIAALHVPEAGIVDFRAVCRALADLVERAGVEIWMSCEVKQLIETASPVVAESSKGSIEARVVVNCAGLQSDRLMTRAKRRGGGIMIVPFRGEYYELVGKPDLVRNLIYPVPDPRMPFLGGPASMKLFDRSANEPSSARCNASCPRFVEQTWFEHTPEYGRKLSAPTVPSWTTS
jgi:L-2-hydroxyglutarate oxidase LhgO